MANAEKYNSRSSGTASPTLSVVVPARNEELYIRPCLEALLNQSEPIDEIIVVDNGSTDDTGIIVKRYAADHANIRLVVEQRPGLPQARNTGFEEASSEIIGRIDADTRVRPDWAEVVRAFFADPANDQVGALTGLNNSYDSPFRSIKLAAVRWQIRRGNLGNGRHIVNMHGANCAIRSSTWQKVRHNVSLRRDIFEDMDLAICIANTGEKIAQPSDMWVDISPRRALTDPIDYFQTYTRAGVLTSRLHGFTGWRQQVSMAYWLSALWIGHLAIWIPYRAWDPGNSRFSVRRVFRRNLTHPLSLTDH